MLTLGGIILTQEARAALEAEVRRLERALRTAQETAAHDVAAAEAAAAAAARRAALEPPTAPEAISEALPEKRARFLRARAGQLERQLAIAMADAEAREAAVADTAATVRELRMRAAAAADAGGAGSSLALEELEQWAADAERRLTRQHGPAFQLRQSEDGGRPWEVRVPRPKSHLQLLQQTARRHPHSSAP